MTKIKAVLIIWLPISLVASILCLLVYLTAQQIIRESLNEPQIQMADELASKLSAGNPVDSILLYNKVDISRSLAPFIIIYNDDGNVIASSGTLNDQNPIIPHSVLNHAKEYGQHKLTWQPQRGVRIAAVVVRYNSNTSGYVLAGRSMKEGERIISRFFLLCVWRMDYFPWRVSYINYSIESLPK
jgi:hypothetical protein